MVVCAASTRVAAKYCPSAPLVLPLVHVALQYAAFAQEALAQETRILQPPSVAFIGRRYLVWSIHRVPLLDDGD